MSLRSMNPKPYSFLFTMLFLLFFQNCSNRKSELVWESNFYRIGTQSSPRVADLNSDGILDIIIGAAQDEYQPLEQGVIAINGKDGSVLWVQAAQDQVFGSATLFDITGDGIQDILIGGRSNMLRAINGANGNTLWEYSYQYEHDSILKYARFNFYNSVLVPDQNQDGYPELLTVNGGNVGALPYSNEDRFPGVLMIFDIRSGEILAADTMPDGKESYMSPIGFSQPQSEEFHIVFGTGGETISGNLYLAKLSDLMENNLSTAKIIASEQGHGFIAPPVAADINKDGYYDVIGVSHGGNIFAIEGKSWRTLWKTTVENAETSSAMAVGNFTGDDIPDFFVALSKGTWPKSTVGIQVVIDGKSGSIVFQDSLGCVGFWSPLAYDLNHDGIEEGIISYSQYNCYRDSTDMSQLDIENKLIAIDFNNGSIYNIDATKNFKNTLATPWLGDLDNDSYLDIVFSQCYSANSNLLSFLGMKVKRIGTSVRIKDPPRWGAYLGSSGDGVYRTNQ